MHRDWLGMIYPWAGQYRTVELQKGSFRWPPAHLVEQNMAQFGRSFLTYYTPCLPCKLPAVAQKIAEVHAELLLIHPFREGNGRLARWLAELMSLQAGFPIPDYGFTGKGSKSWQENYLAAVTRGYGQDYTALISFFAETIRRAGGRRLHELAALQPSVPLRKQTIAARSRKSYDAAHSAFAEYKFALINAGITRIIASPAGRNKSRRLPSPRSVMLSPVVRRDPQAARTRRDLVVPRSQIAGLVEASLSFPI